MTGLFHVVLGEQQIRVVVGRDVATVHLDFPAFAVHLVQDSLGEDGAAGEKEQEQEEADHGLASAKSLSRQSRSKR